MVSITVIDGFPSHDFQSPGVYRSNVSILLAAYRWIFFFNNDFIYEGVRERERQKIRQREKHAPHQEPNMGLDPRLQDHRLSPRQRLKP